MTNANVQVTFENITPAQAQSYLLKNQKNRTPRKRIIDEYASAMRAGKWAPVGDPIRFDINGVLMDGQHRLSAIVSYGHPVPMFVARGIDPKHMAQIDIGCKRKPGDFLKFRGHINTNSLGAALRLLKQYTEKGIPIKDPCIIPFRQDEIDDLLVRFPRIDEHVNKRHAAQSFKCCGFSPSEFAVFSYLTSLANAEKSEHFCSRLVDGANLGEGSPILAARKVIIAEMASMKKRPRRAIFGIVVKAWNAFVSGNSTTRFESPSGFVPQIIGCPLNPKNGSKS